MAEFHVKYGSKCLLDIVCQVKKDIYSFKAHLIDKLFTTL